ncbi:MAG TPA: HAMP domain-containing sensor histidine kinase [Caldilineaceae bacterium]|nr:HAMP domain-containing sensor histidine kinase [Caldilineaceae bacterium]
MSLRWRLTLWQVGLLATILIVFAILSYRFLAAGLAQEVDKSLQERAQHVLHALQVVPNRHLAPVSAPTDEFATPGIYVQVLTPLRVVVAHSDNLGQQKLPIAARPFQAALAGRPSYLTELVGQQPVRLYYEAVWREGRPVGVVQVGQSLRNLEIALRQLQTIYLTGIAIALMLGGSVSWLLVRVGLQPVTQISQMTYRIAQSGDLQERLVYDGPQDEIGRLATTFNQMMARVEAVFEAQHHFIADTAHELRTPLATMLGNLDLLQRYGDDAERRWQALEAIKREGERTARLAANLLLMAQADAGQQLDLHPVALDEVLLEVYEQTVGLTNNIFITLEQCEEALVLGDRDRLTQLLINLIDNACKYGELGGRITLSLTCQDSQACITVSDSGPGIPAADLPHIFERFYRGCGSLATGKSSTGLGLAIVKWLVEAHGGTIAVASQVQQGTTFTIRLPRDKNALAFSTPIAHAASAPTS